MKAGVGALEWNLEFLICLLGGCQGLVVESCVDGINSGECVSDDILAAWDVLNVSGELGDEVQMPELPWGTFLGLLEEGEGERLVISVDSEHSTFNYVQEVLDCQVDC